MKKLIRLSFMKYLKHDRVHEGNWGAWLGGKGKVKFFYLDWQ